MTKLVTALISKLDNLLGTHIELYFKERPWLEKPTYTEEGVSVNGRRIMIVKKTSNDIINYDKEREQVELEIKKVSEAIQKEFSPSRTPTQEVINDIFSS